MESPTALCAWIVEKFWAWTDCDGHPENVLTRADRPDLHATASLSLYGHPDGTDYANLRRVYARP